MSVQYFVERLPPRLAGPSLASFRRSLGVWRPFSVIIIILRSIYNLDDGVMTLYIQR